MKEQIEQVQQTNQEARVIESNVQLDTEIVKNEEQELRETLFRVQLEVQEQEEIERNAKKTKEEIESLVR